MELYAIADHKAEPGKDDPSAIICMDEFGPLNLQPHPGKQWADIASGRGAADAPRRRRRATFTRPNGVRHLMAGYDLSTDRLYGHVTTHKGRTEFLAFCRYLRTLYPPEVRIAIVLDNFSPHRSTKSDDRAGVWARANNVELAYTPTYSSWLNRMECFFSILTRKLLRRGEFSSRDDLVAKMLAFVEHHSETAKPFEWVYDAKVAA